MANAKILELLSIEMCELQELRLASAIFYFCFTWFWLGHPNPKGSCKEQKVLAVLWTKSEYFIIYNSIWINWWVTYETRTKQGFKWIISSLPKFVHIDHMVWQKENWPGFSHCWDFGFQKGIKKKTHKNSICSLRDRTWWGWEHIHCRAAKKFWWYFWFCFSFPGQI